MIVKDSCGKNVINFFMLKSLKREPISKINEIKTKKMSNNQVFIHLLSNVLQ